MAKTRKSGSSLSKGKATHRVTTFGRGGNPPASSTEVAPATGPTLVSDPINRVEIPAGELAEVALKEIADLNSRVQRAHTRFKASAVETKELRESWQALAEQLQTLIAVKTTRPDLPLFDAAQQEADRQGMLQAANDAPADGADAASGEPQDATTGSEAGDGAGPLEIAAPAASEPVEAIPFTLPDIAPVGAETF